jgi:hypothetical protein
MPMACATVLHWQGKKSAAAGGRGARAALTGGASGGIIQGTARAQPRAVHQVGGTRMTKLKPLPPDLLESMREQLWQEGREDLIKAHPELSEDEAREVFWRAMDDAQLQAIYEEGVENMFYDVSGQQRPNRNRH